MPRTQQVVAYNKIDVPDSGDFADIMREELEAEGVLPEDILTISAATGEGVLPLVRRVRKASLVYGWRGVWPVWRMNGCTNSS